MGSPKSQFWGRKPIFFNKDVKSLHFLFTEHEDVKTHKRLSALVL